VRLGGIELTLSVRSFHVRPRRHRCCRQFAFRADLRATRVTSEAKPLRLVHHRFDGVFQRQISPFTSTVILRERFALRHSGGHFPMLRTWPVSWRPSS